MVDTVLEALDAVKRCVGPLGPPGFEQRRREGAKRTGGPYRAAKVEEAERGDEVLEAWSVGLSRGSVAISVHPRSSSPFPNW